jgi:hypothetical protein
LRAVRPMRYMTPAQQDTRALEDSPEEAFLIGKRTIK